MIEIEIPRDPASNTRQKARMVYFTITENLDIQLMPRIYKMNENGEDLFDLAQALPGNSPAKKSALETSHPKSPGEPITTEGSFVNENGEIDPAGTIPEKNKFLSITIGQLKELTSMDDSDSVVMAMMELVKQNMVEIYSRT